MKATKEEYALHLVQDALTECGVSSDDIMRITEALTGAFDDVRVETLRRAGTMLVSSLAQLR